MSDFFYRCTRAFGRVIIFGATHRLVLHAERADVTGGCLLVANHLSYFDAMVLVGTTERYIDWLSIVELVRRPILGRFLKGMNCLALDRGKKDTATTREIVRRLNAGRMVGIFPEAGLRQEAESVIHGGDLNSGVAGLAQLARVPVIPVVVLGAGQFLRPRSWMPGNGDFLAVNYGEPLILPAADNREDRVQARQAMEASLKNAFRFLYDEIKAHETFQKCAVTAWWRKQG